MGTRIQMAVDFTSETTEARRSDKFFKRWKEKAVISESYSQ